MPNGHEEPFKESFVAIFAVSHTFLVEFRVLHEGFLCVLPVKEREVHDWKRGHCYVIKLIEERLVQSLSREG